MGHFWINEWTESMLKGNFAFSPFSLQWSSATSSQFHIQYQFYTVSSYSCFLLLRAISCQALRLLLKYYEFLVLKYNNNLMSHYGSHRIFFLSVKLNALMEINRQTLIGLLAFTLNYDEKFSYHKNICLCYKCLYICLCYKCL